MSDLRTLEELVHYVDMETQRQREWLSRCRSMCEFRIPASLFADIPEAIWRVPVWGHKLLILHAPTVEKSRGGLHLADVSQQKSRYGWVLVPGEKVCDSDGRQAPTGGSVCPYPDPLMLAGQFILFNIFGVKELTFDVSEGGFGRAQKGPQISLCAISDVWFPVIDVKPTDWSADQTEPASRLITQ